MARGREGQLRYAESLVFLSVNRLTVCLLIQDPPACRNGGRDGPASNVPQFSSLQQLTSAIKEAGQRKDWMKAVALLEGKYGVLQQACRGTLVDTPLCSLRTRRQTATQCLHLQLSDQCVREGSAVGTRM